MIERLFEPIKVGHVVLKNRIAMSPMISNLATPEGYPSEAHIAYLAERAKGGIGLVITEYTYVDKVDSRGSVNELGMYSDELLPKYFRLTQLIHDLGSRVFVQLVHAGRKTTKEVIWGNTPIAPSNLPLMGEIREMTKEDVERAKREFIEASVRAKRAGFDGVELHGAHGYLLAQFLSPSTNKRTDEYRDGARLVEEIVRGIKERIDLTVGIRLSVTEFDKEGLTPELVAEYAKRFERAGIDYVHLSAGRDGPLSSSMPFYYRTASFVEEAKVVRETVNVPLFLVGSVITAEDALKVREVADVVVMGRQLLADPHWPRKVLKGLPIRPCIRCNQSCRGVVYKEVRCDVNPELGWESSPPLARGEGEVKIVGGGVKGMEVARVLAMRGFSVTLYEKEGRLGGQLNMVRDPWKYREFSVLVKYYEDELRRLGVKVVLNTAEECKGGDVCVYALPEEGAPEVPRVVGKRVLVDSNVYAYHDYAFELAKSNEVHVTERSLRGLDRTRAYLLRVNLESYGVKVVKEPSGEYDLVLRRFSDDQYSIGKAIRQGYLMARDFGLS
ncbi:MAG: NAD(P)-binding protein [Candidatus Aramenus sp.]|jgi:2,4-dienoyl-CoA reductase-like NADH-dependent reductase (Old Yellow Enzyme family)|nr:NAD(P)-binding protein [Candidatus Aramenus sp.]